MRTILVSLALSSFCCVARSQEVDWQPATQMRAVVEDIELVTKSGTRKANAVILTGLVSIDQRGFSESPDANKNTSSQVSKYLR